MAPRTAIVLADSEMLAQRAGLHPELVSRLLRIGAIDPLRPDAAARLARIARLRRDLGLNYAGAVLACELLCAAQGLEFLRPLRPGRGVEAAYRHIREQVRPLGRDRTLHRDLDAVERLIRSGSLLAAVEAAIGRLE